MADQPQDESIFSNKQETPADPNKTGNADTSTPPESNPLENLLNEIKNEKGEPKYKSVADALVGLKHAQEYIPQVKQQKSEADAKIEEMQAELERLKSLEETVLELTRKKEQTSTNGVVLNEEDIAQLVERSLTKKQQQDIQTANIQTVVASISEKFGKDAEAVFYNKAKELGLTVEEMNALAAKTPKAVLTLLGVSETGAHKQPSASPTQSTVNTSAFQPTPQTYLGREQTRVAIGATTDDIKQAVDRSAKLVEELHQNGLTTYDLTDPKLYQKYFK